ncbi:caspase recruitment domain-containing protein 8-like [Anolis sagrei]|uniref:caspase recruitment domain-containing protein 8-like n=1 Tax=Anolis sagrei TaxID=38937 RepID=UPI003522CB26
MEALADLRERDLWHFMRQLCFSLGAHRVPAAVWREARAPQLAEILLRFRPGEASTDLAIRLLEKIGYKDQAKKLRKSTEKEKGRWEENDDELEEFFKCPQCPSKDLTIKIQPELPWDHIEGHYRLNCTKAGSFRCCVTDLIFDVNAPVALTYCFDSWSQNLNEEHRKQWEIVGPLLNIQADPEEAVAAVHFPHFLCLEGKGCSEIYLAHFGEKGMSLEKPDSVGPYHVELKNLTPCPCGAVLKKSRFEGKIKAHAITLLYWEHRYKYTLRFYLLPNDSSLKQAVNKRELLSHKVQNPSQTMQPLIIGSHFVLKSTPGLSIYPKKLQFKYPPTDRHIQYLELYLEFMEDVLELVLLEDDTNDLVWKAFIKQEEWIHADFHPVIVRSTALLGHRGSSERSFSKTCFLHCFISSKPWITY